MPMLHEFHYTYTTYTAIRLRGVPTRATCEAPDDSSYIALLFLPMLSQTTSSSVVPPKWMHRIGKVTGAKENSTTH